MRLLLNLIGFGALAIGVYSAAKNILHNSPMTRDTADILQVIARLLFSIGCLLLSLNVFFLSCYI
jgi:hypothetical protein